MDIHEIDTSAAGVTPSFSSPSSSEQEMQVGQLLGHEISPQSQPKILAGKITDVTINVIININLTSVPNAPSIDAFTSLSAKGKAPAAKLNSVSAFLQGTIALNKQIIKEMNFEVLKAINKGDGQIDLPAWLDHLIEFAANKGSLINVSELHEGKFDSFNQGINILKEELNNEFSMKMEQKQNEIIQVKNKGGSQEEIKNLEHQLHQISQNKIYTIEEFTVAETERKAARHLQTKFDYISEKFESAAVIKPKPNPKESHKISAPTTKNAPPINSNSSKPEAIDKKKSPLVRSDNKEQLSHFEEIKKNQREAGQAKLEEEKNYKHAKIDHKLGVERIVKEDRQNDHLNNLRNSP